jgi:light-regulated signal transduction histidine kinase (bacteriophytochrome)
MAGAVLVTRVGGVACAFPIAHVVETMRPLPIEPIGGSDSALALVDGLAMVRGAPIPVIDARRLLGIPGAPATRFVIVRAAERRVALVVDAVIDIRLDGASRSHLRRVLAATSQMSDLIDALLALSQISRVQLVRSTVELSATAHAVIDEHRRHEPERCIDVIVANDLRSHADAKLMRVLFDNLLGNAWKFTSRRTHGRIEVGAAVDHSDRVFFVRDNGAGFDEACAEQLFTPFHRLHSDADFAGTGIGLATVHRIIERHGGRIWAEGTVDAGATFYFTLPPPP